jgi:hypothetical protein
VVVYLITFSSSGGDSKIFQLISYMCVVINFFRLCVCGDSASDLIFQVVIQSIVGGVCVLGQGQKENKKRKKRGVCLCRCLLLLHSDVPPSPLLPERDI